MQLQYLKPSKYTLFDKKRGKTTTGKDVLKLCANISIWLILTTCAYLAIEFIQRDGIDAVKELFATNPKMIIVNYLILLLITSPALLFKRTHFVSMILCGISGILCCISVMVLEFRGVPLIWSDIYTVGEGLSIAHQYIDVKLAAMIAGAVGVLLLTLIGVFFIRFKVYNIKVIWRILIWACITIGLFFSIKTMASQPGVFEDIAWDVRVAYNRNGFVYSFVDSYLATFRKEPEGYSKEAVKEIKTKLAADTVQTEATPNIIMIQLEGIMDPYTLKGLTFSEDPIANFRKIGVNQASGVVQVPTLGGGTVRTEFEMLTSMDIDQLSPGEIPHNSGVLKKEAVESLAHVLKADGYYTTAIHNFQGNFYSRQDAFATLGFDTFIPMEAMKNLEKIGGVWPKDHVVLDYIKKSIQASEEQDFIYAITVGSHGPYTEGAIPENAIGIQGNISEAGRKELDIYLQRLKEVDKFVGNLVDYVNGLEEHTVLVLFSDHYPSMEVIEQVEGEEKFLVPFVAMDNKQNLKGKLPKKMEAYELSTYMLDLYGLQGGIMNSYQRVYREEENYKALMNVIQYDMLFGNKYITEGKNPYKTSAIQLGMNELKIDRIIEEIDKILVKGDGFNQSSQIFVDNQEVETEYIDGQTLKLGGGLPSEYKGIVVKQLGRNKIPLLDSNKYITEK
ncbi:MAG: LTA synthase family protein [Cellulosilyticaceae bacterium]